MTLDRLYRDVENLKKQYRGLAGGPQLALSSIENGAIDSKDADGNLKMTIGQQDDGGNTINVISGPTPPTPVGFTVDVDHGKFIVHWSGDFDGDKLAPSDWSRAEVHASQDPFFVPDRTTARGSIVSAAGGEVTIGVLKGPWTIKMLAWSQAGKMSAPSAPVDVEVPGYGEIVLEEIDAAQTRIDNARAILVDGQETLGTKLDEADTALASLRDSLDNLDETTLPALRQDLDAAEGRLSDAEGQITDAFGQLDAVPGQISDARQAAIDAAQEDAEAKASAAEQAAKAHADLVAEGAEADAVAAAEVRAQELADAAQDAAEAAAQVKADAARDEAIDAATEAMGGIPRPSYGRDVPTHDAPDGSVYFQTDPKALATFEWAGSPHASESIKHVDGVEVSRNLMSSPSFETPGGWAAVGGTAVYNSNFKDQMWDGGGSGNNLAQVAADGSNAYLTLIQSLNTRFAVTPGQWVGVAMLVANDGTGIQGVRSDVVCTGTATTYHNSGSFISSGFYAGRRITYAIQVPATGSLAQVRVQMYSGASATPIPAGKRMWVDSVMAVTANTEADALATVSTYFDGDTPDGVINAEDKVTAQWERRDGAWVQVPIRSEAIANLDVGKLTAGVAEIAEQVSIRIAAAVGQFLELDVGQLTVTGASKLASVVAEQIAADVGEYVELSVGQLVAGEGVMDEATVEKLFTDVVVAGISQAQEFIGENAILTGAVTAPKITASEELWAKIANFVKIRSEHIESDAIDFMVGRGLTLIAGNDRHRLDDSGYALFDDNGDRRTFLSPEGSTFKGEVEAETFVANGGAELRGTNNTLAQGAKLTLAAGVTDPTAPPTVQPYWEGVEFTPPSDATPAGLAFDGTHYWTAESWPEVGAAWKIDAATGAAERVSLPVSWGRLFGVTCIGSELYWLTLANHTSKVIATDLNLTEKREFEFEDIGFSSTNPLVYDPGIGTDGTNVLIGHCSDGGTLYLRTYNPTTGAKTATVSSDNFKNDVTGAFRGSADFGMTRTVVSRPSSYQFRVGGTDLAYDGSRSWDGPSAAEVAGFCWTGTRFASIGADGQITEYADINTGDASGDWWAVYAWAEDWDDNGITETWSRISPPKRFTWPRRAGIKLIGQPLPDGVQMILPAIAKKTTFPTRTDFHSPTWSFSEGRPVAWYDELPTDWDSRPSPRDNNNFPDAEKSVIESASGTFHVDGAGSGWWGPLTFNGTTMTGIPKMAAGKGETVTVTSGGFNTKTVSFPAGRFTSPPAVTVSADSTSTELVNVNPLTITKDGFTLSVRRTNNTPTTVDWIAMEVN